jgi:actin-like ATPase involved in cell morphogenesis
MACETNNNIIAIDAGTGFVKCVSSHLRRLFPSIYASRRLTRWENPKEGTVDAVGYEAVEMSVYPDTVLVRAVLEGKIAEEKAFVSIIREAVRELGCERDANSLLIVMGLPYGAASQKQNLEKLVERALKPKRILVISQSIGTLLAEDARTGIVLSIGQGTTEIVLFENLKPIAGISIQQACDFLYEDDLAYLEYEQNNMDRKKINALTTILANKLAAFKTRLNKDYDIYVSGGGALVPGLYESLQEKIHNGLRIVKDPVYSNATGLYKLGQIISSTGVQQVTHHLQ